MGLVKVEKRECPCGAPVHYVVSGLCRRCYDRRQRRDNTRICTVDGCGRKTKTAAYPLCLAHWQRQRRYGDLGDKPIRVLESRTPTYKVAHQRLTRQRGKARDYTCQMCHTQQANEWAYTYGAGDRELTEVHANRNRKQTVLRYSADPQDYAPLCRSCHVKHDQHYAAHIKRFDAAMRLRGVATPHLMAVQS